MTAIEALRQATREAKAMSYDREELRQVVARLVPDQWQTPAETSVERQGLCRDFAIWTCWRAWSLAGGLVPPDRILMVLGHVDAAGRAQGQWHAWVQLDVGGEVLWAEPTPGYHEQVDALAWFAGRFPVYAQLYDGEVLDQEFEYRWVA